MAKWTEKEVEILKNNWELYSDAELKELLIPNHTIRAIKWKRQSLSLFKKDMDKTFSFDDFYNECLKRDYIIISDKSEYKTTTTKLKYMCKKHMNKGVMEITTSHLLSNRGCYYCGRERTTKAKRNIHSVEYYKEITEKHGFEFVDTFIDTDGIRKISFVCKKHKDKGIQIVYAGTMKRDDLYTKGCIYCTGQIKTDEDFKKEMYDLNKDILILSTYINQKEKVECKCLIHNEIFSILPNNMLKGQTGCQECVKIKMTELKKSAETYQNEVNIYNPHIKVLEYNGMTEFSKFYCEKHSIEFMMHSTSLIKRHTGCQKCSGYSSEISMSEILDEYNIEYIKQKKYKDCINKRPLPFDFYLPYYDLLIETDGEQHTRPVKFGGISKERADINFEKTKKNDNTKNEYCKNNNIKLIRIPHTEFNNMESYFLEELNKLNINI